MARYSDPVIGGWYKNLDTDQVFTVIEIDEESEVLEVEYDDGDVEQLSMADWDDLEIEPVSEPDEWDTAIDDLALSEYDEDREFDLETTPEDETAEGWQ